MAKQVDPTDASFKYDSLIGDEVLLCRECGSSFGLDYADAISNDDARLPAAKCCQKMIGEFLRLQFANYANNMIVSKSSALRNAAVNIRNEIARQREEDGKEDIS